MSEVRTEGIIRLYVDVKVDAAEMRHWSPQAIEQFFAGIALLQDAVQKGRDDLASESPDETA